MEPLPIFSGWPPPTQRVANPPDVDLPSSLKLLLKSYLPYGYPRIELAAEATGMSVRTLQRRLADAGTTYSEVIDRARFEVAADLIKKPGVKLIDVAYDLGYEAPSSFTRAFRRMAGVSPQSFRGSGPFRESRTRRRERSPKH